jgi:hypothetical protein
MKSTWRAIAVFVLFALAPFFGFGQNPDSSTAFTVSLNPAAHLYHVVFRVEGLAGEIQDFKLPVWMPGYYGLQSYAANIQDFRASDDAGRPLAWEKTTDNCWRVASAGSPVVIAAYDVLATSSFVAHNYLGEDRGYIAPVGVFMYLDGRIHHPVTLTIESNPKWDTIATGLDRLSPDSPATFTAPDFDVLYDCPIVLGNLDHLPPPNPPHLRRFWPPQKAGAPRRSPRASVPRQRSARRKIPSTRLPKATLCSGSIARSCQ